MHTPSRPYARFTVPPLPDEAMREFDTMHWVKSSAMAR